MTVEVMSAGAAGAGLIVGFVAGYLVGRGRSATAGAGGHTSSQVGDGIELYVGNLSYDMSDPELQKAFSSFGKVLSARIIKNKFNDRSKGYGFVEMDGQAAADKAVKAMSGNEVMGRKLVVNEARSKSRD